MEKGEALKKKLKTNVRLVQDTDQGAVKYEEAFEENIPGGMKGELRGYLLCNAASVREWIRLVEEEKIYPVGLIPFQQNVIETFDLEIAQIFIERNFSNRRLDPATYKKYARSLEAGRWRSHGEGVKVWLDKEGSFGKPGFLVMVDAQHRCYAVTTSGIPIKHMSLTLITDKEALQYIDVDARVRSNADMRRMRGDPPRKPAVMAGIVHEHFDFHIQHQNLSKVERDKIISDCQFSEQLQDLHRGSISAAFVAAALRCMKADGEGSLVFFQAVADPTNYSGCIDEIESYPVKQARKFIERLRTKKFTADERTRIEASRIIQAYMAWKVWKPAMSQFSLTIPVNDEHKRPNVPGINAIRGRGPLPNRVVKEEKEEKEEVVQ